MGVGIGIERRPLRQFIACSLTFDRCRDKLKAQTLSVEGVFWCGFTPFLEHERCVLFVPVP